MRSIESLVIDYPNKTGKEYLEMQRKDIEADELAYQQANKKELEMINDINTNGGYYRGRFGIDQHYFYNFTNLRILHNKIYCDVEDLVLFTGVGRGAVTNDFTVKIEKREYRDFDTFGIDLTDMVERVTKKEWDEVVNYFKKSSELFWKKEK